MKPKPKVGETLIAVEPARHSIERRQYAAIVIKVGRKYFTCRMGGMTAQFHLSSWLRAGQNMHANFPIYLYRTDQEMLDTDEAKKLSRDLSDQLTYHHDWAKLSLQQLRAIKQILDTP